MFQLSLPIRLLLMMFAGWVNRHRLAAALAKISPGLLGKNRPGWLRHCAALLRRKPSVAVTK
jgi:hypothetical protein